MSATVLELRCEERERRLYLVPKRNLPESGSSQWWHIAPLDLSIGAGILDTTGELYDLRELWQICYGSDAILGCMGSSRALESVLPVEFRSGWRMLRIRPDDLYRSAAQCAARRTVPGIMELWDHAAKNLPMQVPPKSLDVSLEDAVKKSVIPWLQEKHVENVLLIGGLLDMPMGSDNDLGTRVRGWLHQEGGFAANIFGHTGTKHDLVTPREHASVQHGIRVGSVVRFEFEGRRLVGQVNSVNRRATVLVEDAKGLPYSDGKKYRKFYVSLEALSPATV